MPDLNLHECRLLATWGSLRDPHGHMYLKHVQSLDVMLVVMVIAVGFC